jgi:methyltransferase
MIVSVVILALVTAQRLAELVFARRNTRRLLARGGIERGAKHYPMLVGLHASWLAGLWLLRTWVLASMANRWTTRIIVVPGETLVRKGPYRFLSHPNYIVVAGEIAVLPLVFGLTGFAVAFSLLNASMLWLRIRTEEKALAEAASQPLGQAPA